MCQNTIKYSEPEKTTGPSGVIPIAVLKEESMVDRLLSFTEPTRKYKENK